MARVYNDRVKEAASTSGTGTFTMSGTASDASYQTVGAGIADGNSSFFCAVDVAGGKFEIFDGTCTVGGSTTLTRDRVLNGSSGAGTLVNFTNPPTIWCDFPSYLAAMAAASAALNLAANAGAL